MGVLGDTFIAPGDTCRVLLELLGTLWGACRGTLGAFRNILGHYVLGECLGRDPGRSLVDPGAARENPDLRAHAHWVRKVHLAAGGGRAYSNH